MVTRLPKEEATILGVREVLTSGALTHSPEEGSLPAPIPAHVKRRRKLGHSALLINGQIQLAFFAPNLMHKEVDDVAGAALPPMRVVCSRPSPVLVLGLL